MFYVVRSYPSKEVLGLLNRAEVLTEKEYEPYRECSPDIACGCLQLRFRRIINAHYGNWTLEVITQAEYETYRDLHGFKVIKRNSS